MDSINISTAVTVLENLDTLWHGCSTPTRVFLSIVALVAARRHKREAYAFGPITMGYLVTLTALLASAFLLWDSIDDIKDPAQISQLVTGFLLVSATFEGSSIALLVGLVYACVAVAASARCRTWLVGG